MTVASDGNGSHVSGAGPTFCEAQVTVNYHETNNRYSRVHVSVRNAKPTVPVVGHKYSDAILSHSLDAHCVGNSKNVRSSQSLSPYILIYVPFLIKTSHSVTHSTFAPSVPIVLFSWTTSQNPYNANNRRMEAIDIEPLSEPSYRQQKSWLVSSQAREL